MTASSSSAANASLCLVYPDQLSFSSNDQATFKQILTIYNPFDFPLNFKILSTTPKAYHVRPPKGTIKARSSADIVIRLKEFSASRQDKFMVKVTDLNDNQLNSKVILADLKWGPPVSSSSSQKSAKEMEERRRPDDSVSGKEKKKSNWSRIAIFMLVVGIVAAVVVILDPSWIFISTNFFSLSTGQQMILAFLLGMVAMVFLRNLL